MKVFFNGVVPIVLLCLIAAGCSSKIKQQEDEIYSRHLQEHIRLTIINTPLPDKKNDINLLLLNDGQDLGAFGVKDIVDSLCKKKQLQPLIIVGIHAGNRIEDYGVSGYPDYQGNGNKADKYAAFINNELYDFVKKKAGVRKFHTVVLAGCSLGGLSALDVAWDNADKIDKVGVFSGSFWWRDKDAAAADYSDQADRIMMNKIRLSRKKPRLKYWFYTGNAEEAGDRDKDGIIDVTDDTRDLVAIIKSKNLCPPGDIAAVESPGGKHDYASWRKALPGFLLWAFGQ